MLSNFGLDKQLGLQTLIKTTEAAVITQTSFYTRNQRPDEVCALLGRQTRMVRKRLRLHETTKNKARCRLHDPHLTRTVQRVRDTAREVLAQIRA